MSIPCCPTVNRADFRSLDGAVGYAVDYSDLYLPCFSAQLAEMAVEQRLTCEQGDCTGCVKLGLTDRMYRIVGTGLDCALALCMPLSCFLVSSGATAHYCISSVNATDKDARANFQRAGRIIKNQTGGCIVTEVTLAKDLLFCPCNLIAPEALNACGQPNVDLALNRAAMTFSAPAQLPSPL